MGGFDTGEVMAKAQDGVQVGSPAFLRAGDDALWLRSVVFNGMVTDLDLHYAHSWPRLTPFRR